MPSIEKIKTYLNKIWDILKVLSILFLIGSTVVSAIVWLAVNVFYPESIAIEVVKYFLLILVPTTISAIMLQAYKNSQQYFNDIFAYHCPNCNNVIWLDIPSAMVKEIHLVDGLPKGKFLQGREEQVICEKCKNAYHIVYP
jgi:uncharacterized protein YbaR (Trm112 family)